MFEAPFDFYCQQKLLNLKTSYWLLGWRAGTGVSIKNGKQGGVIL